MNTFGNKLRLTTFGESHGKAIGGVIDGFPAGFKINFDALREEVAKRRPGSSNLVTQRNESDEPEFLSGINEEGVTLGTSIGFIIRNNDNRGKDYSEVENKYRPNHADFTYDARYNIRDHRGGGRASARETANWVIAGALAQQWLQSLGISVEAVLSSVGKISFTNQIIEALAQNSDPCMGLRIPQEVQEKIQEQIIEAKNDGDSIGGVVTCVINGVKAGIGNPVAQKLQSCLAQAMMSINAAKGFEYGIGFQAAHKRGSETLDIFKIEKNIVQTETNYSGGIQGGITNGMPIYFNVAFKPTPTLMMDLPTITKDKEITTLKMKGRHDPCVAVRAVPVVKAMASLVIADFLV